MLWHPMHIATRASTDFILSAGCAAGAAGAAALVAAGAWASAGAVAQATASAKSAENRFFILGAELLVDYIGGHPRRFRPPPMKFQGSQNYVATQDLMLAVNA